MKKYFYLAVLLAAGLIVSGNRVSNKSTFVASDDMNRADAGTLGANWGSIGTPVWTVVSNRAANVSAGAAISKWIGAGTFTANQSSRGSSPTLAAGSGVGPAVRIGAGASGYGLLYDTTGWTAFNLGTFGVVGTGTWTATSTDIVDLSAVGTTMTVYLNGVSSGWTFTDATYATGSPGFISNNTGTTQTFDNWEGRNL